MKKSFIPVLTGLLLSCVILKANAQESKEQSKAAAKQEARRIRFKEKYPEEYKDQSSKTFNISKNALSALLIYNVNGSIKVQGYAGDKILMEIDETISAPDLKTLDIAKKEFKLGFDEKPDSIIAFVAAPYDSRPHHDWYYNDNDRKELDYRAQVNYSIKVPYDLSLHISTVNDGIITVNDVSGALHVNNVNDGIVITNAKGTTYAHTVNGDVRINYVSNPTEQSSYNTVNGDIKVSYQPSLSADMQFKTMNGDFYTDFSEVQILPVTATKDQNTEGSGTIYKISKGKTIRFGKGGTTFKFGTLNGSVYIKKQS